MQPKDKLDHVMDCCVILWTADGSVTLVLRPGERIHWVIGGDPPPPGLARALNSACAIIETGTHEAAIREDCIALAKKMIGNHEIELHKFIDSQVSARV